MWLIIIQFIFNVPLAVFMRTCMDFRGRRDCVIIRIPRMFCLIMIASSFVPVFGISFPVISIIILILQYRIELRDNRFTRYWFKS
jgi:hypothetical protein